MRISLQYTDEDWRKLNFDDESSWQKAIDMLEARISERYFSPVDLLIKAEQNLHFSQRKFGFAIVAIDCLLVETFESFIEGIENSDGQSRKLFVRFLTTRPRFEKYFSKEAARRFYTQFRSGILHQGEVQGNGLVWSVGSLAMDVDGRMVINRTAFHQALKEEFNDYIFALRNPDKAIFKLPSPEINLRENLRKKMNAICNR